MGYELPEKLKNIKAYEPVSGEFRTHLDANESFLFLTEEILDEIGQAVKKIQYNRYPDPESRGVCRKYAELLGIRPEIVMAGNGSDELISLIMANFADPGDRVLVAAPDFSMYEFYALSCGLSPVILDKENLVLDKEALIEKAKETNSKIVIFSNPCNPSSLELSEEDVLEIAGRLDCLVVADEAYMDFSDSSIADRTEEYENLIVLKTCSKAFGLAAIRLGFAVSNERLTGILKTVKSPYNVNTLTQTVGEIVLSHKEYLKRCRDKICKERDYLYQEIEKLQQAYPNVFTLYPTKTNFVFLKTDCGEKIYEGMKAEKIAVRLMKGSLRICTGSREENNEMLAVLEDCLKEC